MRACTCCLFYFVLAASLCCAQQVLWKTPVNNSLEGWWKDATVRPSLDGRFVYASGTDGPQGSTVLYCLNAKTGSVVWRSTTNITCTSFFSIGPSALYINDMAYLYAYDLRTGALRWRSRLHHIWNYTEAFEVGGNVYLLSQGIHAYSAATGELREWRWEHEGDCDVIDAIVVVNDGVLTSIDCSAVSGELFVIKVSLDVTKPAKVVWNVSFSAVGTLAYHILGYGQAVYFIQDRPDWSGIITSIDPKTGKFLWRYDEPKMYGIVAHVETRSVIVFENQKVLSSHSAATGKTEWALPVPHAIQDHPWHPMVATKEWICGSATMVDAVGLWNYGLFCVNATDGSAMWRLPIQVLLGWNPTESAVTTDGKNLYFGVKTGHKESSVFALDPLGRTTDVIVRQYPVLQCDGEWKDRTLKQGCQKLGTRESLKHVCVDSDFLVEHYNDANCSTTPTKVNRFVLGVCYGDTATTSFALMRCPSL